MLTKAVSKTSRGVKPSKVCKTESKPASTARTPISVSTPKSFHTSTSLKMNDTKKKSLSLLQLSENFLNGSSSVYVEQMYDSWKENPASVHASWAAFFKNVEAGIEPGFAFQAPPTSVPKDGSAPLSAPASASNLSDLTITESMRLLLLVRAYQVRGHVIATLDPLGLTQHATPPELLPSTYGFSDADLDRQFYLGDNILSGFLSANRYLT
jgi:2-oxoglutarate dehydrogenase E1 component